ncbi:MAG: NYN domain-containing protein [Actinomycetota bacterium]|nr:NYN domain-containing protein [Actinomycetota bacterium]
MSTSLDGLPERVRVRLLVLAADALPGLATEHLPAPLRRVAAFAPARRARLGGAQILALLGTDEDFRERVGVQVRAAHPKVAADLDDRRSGLDAAALAVLERPAGWERLVARTAEAEEVGEQVLAESATRGQSERLERRVGELTEQLAGQRQAAKAAHHKLREENTELRRRLGEARALARRTAADADRARAEATAAQQAAGASQTTAETDVRRMRTQIEALERELTLAQRSGRAERVDATIRARLLLDTLVEAGDSLRKELALPVGSGAPADSVDAEHAEPGPRLPSGSASMASDDPALLQQLLGLPRVHLIVDGYNLTKSEWGRSSLEIQRERLMRGMASLAAGRTGTELTVVFDAGSVEQRPVVSTPRGVRVLFSRYGMIADDVIRDLVAAEPAGRPVVVVTSDRAVVTDVTRKPGVRAVGSRALARLLARS